MPPSSEPAFLRPTAAPQRSVVAPNAQQRNETAGHPKHDGRADFEDHVTSRAKARTAEKGPATPAPQLVDAVSKEPTESAPKAEADPETVPLTAFDDRMLRQQAGTPAAVLPVHQDVAVPEATPEQAQATADAEQAEQTERPSSHLEPGIARAGSSDTRQPFTAARQPQSVGSAVKPAPPPVPTVPAQPDLALGTLDAESAPEGNDDLPGAPVRTGPETASASPAVAAFRSHSLVPQTFPTIGPDTGGPGTDTALQAGSGRGADWRLEAISGSPAPAFSSEGRTGAVTAHPQAVAGQITVALTRTRERSVEIRLDPPELGRVQIRLDPAEDGLRAVLLAERPETQDFLRRHADTLIRDLRDAGYENVLLGFDAGGEMPGERDGREDRAILRPASPVTPAAGSDIPATNGRGRSVSETGLDIRL